MPELRLKLRGAIPANLMPFKTDLSIDEVQYRRHMRWLADVPGVSAIVCNGHAAEVAALTEDEQIRAIAVARDEVGGKVKLVAGVFTDGTAHAVRLARNAKKAGADGVLVFPPSLFLWGGNLRPEMAYRHFAAISDQADIPIVVFQYPIGDGWGYSTELLLKLAEIENVVAVKEWSQDIVTFERNLRALQSALQAGRRAEQLQRLSLRHLCSWRRWLHLRHGKRGGRLAGADVRRRATRRHEDGRRPEPETLRAGPGILRAAFP